MNKEVMKIVKGLEAYDWEQRISKSGQRVVYVRFKAPVRVRKITVIG